jgi:hypothetical protein
MVECLPMLHVRCRQRRFCTAQELPAFPVGIKPDRGSVAPLASFVTVSNLAFLGHLAPLDDDGITLIEGKIGHTVS